jgi:addiction module HigA family antidote
LPLTPGAALREFVLDPHGITQDDLARAMGVSRYSINQLVNDRRSLTAAMALRLGKATSTTPEFWLKLQLNADLARGRQRLERHRDLEKVRVVRQPIPDDALYFESSD